MSAPLIAEGLVAKKLDGRFRGLRNDYIPDFKKSADDYLQYSPLAVMVGLKAFGVEGRSSWGEDGGVGRFFSRSDGGHRRHAEEHHQRHQTGWFR